VKLAPASRAAAGSISPARTVAFIVIRRVFEQGAYADRALNAEATDLPSRDRAFAMALAYGVVQRRATLDHLAERLSARALAKLDPPVRAALRLGLFQLLFLDGVADHAAVNESVELVKRAQPGGSALVNAVLRRAVREGRGLLAELSDRSAADAALCHSVPVWLAEMWWDELGAERARELLQAINRPAEAALRVNELVTTRDELLGELPVAAEAAPGLPEGVILNGGFDAHASPLFARGAIMPQSRGSMVVARTLAPQPGERVLDLCAAPGGKTTHLAALMHDRREVLAVERHRGRARALSRTCARMHSRAVRVETGDASQRRSEAAYDRVLVDPPCSGLGTLQSRPDLRWRATPASITELAALQARILAAGAAMTAPGGSLVYSVCTISRREGVDLVRAFLAAHPQFCAEDLSGEPREWGGSRRGGHLQLYPDRDDTDGFFIARLRRR
jgi:16S rRNA (cytosine967-C5)-methyltransferase